MKKKIFICLLVIIFIVILYFATDKKSVDKIGSISQLNYYKIKFDDYEEYDNLKLLCYSEQENNICNLYDKTVSYNKPIETIKGKKDEYLLNYIKFGDFDYEEDYFYETNDTLSRNIDFINDFYSIYTKTEECYQREFKIRGNSAEEYINNDKYIIYKEKDNDNYFLIPKNYVTDFSSFVINDTNAVCIFIKEDKKYVYPKVIIYNYKNGNIVKEYDFDKLKNIYSYEDSPVGYNEDENLFILYEKNFYLNLDNFKELILNNASFEYDKLIINKNKVYDYKLNLLKEFNDNETPIFIQTVEDVYEIAHILYKKDNKIYNLNNKVIYELGNKEKYYTSDDIMIFYNNKYITKAIDINGNILFDNSDNKYNIGIPKNFIDLIIDKNGNLIDYNDDISNVKCLRNDITIDYNYQIGNIYIKENNNNIILYDKDLNILNTLNINNTNIYRVDYYLENNKYIRIELNIGNEEKHDYSINYLYDISNNKFLDEIIYLDSGFNYMDFNDYNLVLGGNENNFNDYLYYVTNKIIKIKNDLNIKSVYTYNSDEIIFEVDDQNYILIPISELNKIIK